MFDYVKAEYSSGRSEIFLNSGRVGGALVNLAFPLITMLLLSLGVIEEAIKYSGGSYSG